MIITVLFGFFLFASAIVANKLILHTLSPMLFVGIRMLAGGIILMAYNWRRSTRFTYSYLRNDVVILLCISLFTTLIPSVLKAYALKNLFTSQAAFLASLDPFVTAVYAYIIWQEKLSVQKTIGILLGFIGTLILLRGNLPLTIGQQAWGMLSYPEIAALLAMAIGRLGWMLVQKVVRADRYSPSEVNGIIMVVSGLCSLIIALATEPLPSVIPNDIVKLIGLFAFTVIIGNVIAYTMYSHFLRHYSSTFVSLAGFSIPLYVYFLSWLLLDEPITTNLVLATAVTLIGVYLFYQNEIRHGLLTTK